MAKAREGDPDSPISYRGQNQEAVSGWNWKCLKMYMFPTKDTGAHLFAVGRNRYKTSMLWSWQHPRRNGSLSYAGSRPISSMVSSSARPFPKKWSFIVPPGLQR